jgi:tryptophanyl-tRNA synthetase
VSERKRVFSGIQPTGTGELHIGNLVGALRNWVEMQTDYDTIYCVVDLHAMTVPYDAEQFSSARRTTAKTLLAVGVDPARSLLYYQSQVPQHAELAWILSTITGIGQLERMTQFKDKADKAGQNLGLLAYPVLMAADILLHKVHAVPVGDDQTQHLELTRDLAERFNSRFGEEFPVPERITPKLGARVMSLLDPYAKMSKSDASAGAYVLLTDEPDVVRKKIKSAVTDSERYVEYDWELKPGIANLLELSSFFSGRPIADLVTEFHDAGYGRFKEAVAEVVVEGLTPIRTRFKALDDAEVTHIMQKGALEARQRSEAEMQSVRRKVGLAG